MDLAQRIENVMTTLYDYEYIDIEKFWNDDDNREILNTIDRIVYTGKTDENDHRDLHDLYNNLAYFIRFETNYNSTIGDF
jgi:hypothetical protein